MAYTYRDHFEFAVNNKVSLLIWNEVSQERIVPCKSFTYQLLSNDRFSSIGYAGKAEILFIFEAFPLYPSNIKLIFWSCQIMRDLHAEEEVSTKRQKTSCTSVSSSFNSNSSPEASVSVPRALSFSNTSAWSSPVTAALTTTEGNVMPAIAGPSETDECSFQDNPFAPPSPVYTSTPRPKCTRCAKNRKK